MAKDFDAWNMYKKRLDSRTRRIFYYEREVWWCAIGLNIGSEQNGKGNLFQRPVVIIRVLNKNLFLAIPLTTQFKQSKFCMPIGVVNGKEAFALLSQVRVFDTKRLLRKIGTVNQRVLESLRDSVSDVVHKRI